MRSVSRRAILLRPALDLPGDVVLAAAEIGEPDRGRIERMQPRQRRIHRVVDRGALGRRRLRHVRFPEHAAAHMAHEIERRAGDALVGAVEQRRGDRKALRMQRADHAELAVDRMRRRQQLAGRLAAQHVAPAGRLDQVGRVRLPALELPQAERPRIAGQRATPDRRRAAPDRWRAPPAPASRRKMSPVDRSEPSSVQAPLVFVMLIGQLRHACAASSFAA